MTETRSVTVERVYPFPAECLWRALTEPALITEWLMRTDFVPEIGHGFTLTGDWGGVVQGRVLALEPGRQLSWAWDFPSDDPAFDLRSVVTFTLDAVPGGTRLTVVQHGFRADQVQAHAGARAGWPRFLEKLGTVVEQA